MRMLSCSPGLWRASAYQSGLTGASMSLTDLWAAHTSGDRGLKKMSTASMPSAAVVQGSAAAPLKRKRVSDDTIQQQKPQSRARASARSLPAGETDLGSGSILIYKPRTFKQSQQLFKTLQVIRCHATDLSLSSVRMCQLLTSVMLL